MSFKKAKEAMNKTPETHHPRHQIESLTQALELTLKACTMMNEKIEELERRMNCVEMSTT